MIGSTNAIIPAAAAALFTFEYTGGYTDDRVDGVGTITFTSTGTLTVTAGGTADLYLIGGGGGGGAAGYSTYVINGGFYSAGGGGSGYWNTIENFIIEPGTYEIVVGAGGAGGKILSSGGNRYTLYAGSSGESTTAFGYTVNGGSGGGAGGASPGAGGAGGNNGSNGAYYNSNATAGGSPNGGAGYPYVSSSWGGGSAGSAGWVTLTFA